MYERVKYAADAAHLSMTYTSPTTTSVGRPMSNKATVLAQTKTNLQQSADASILVQVGSDTSIIWGCC